MVEYYAVPIRKILVPHFGHVPLIAGRPFFNLVFLGSLTVRFARHFTQYAVTITDYIRNAIVFKGM